MEHRFKISKFDFWQQWLFYSSISFALFGVVFAFHGDNPMHRLYDNILAQAIWQSPNFPPEAETFRDFIYAPIGATIACAYILLAYIARYPFQRKERWARNAIIFAFSVWVIIDSFMCFRYKVYPQIYLVNLFSIVVKALPLVFTWKEFTKGEDSQMSKCGN